MNGVAVIVGELANIVVVEADQMHTLGARAEQSSLGESCNRAHAKFLFRLGNLERGFMQMNLDIDLAAVQLDDLLARLTSVSAPGMALAAVSVAMCDASDADDFVFSDHAAEPSADAIDFNALLSQPESFFASEEVAGDLGPIARVGVTSTDDGDESSDHGAASSNPFVSSILGTLDIGGKDTASNTAEPELEQTPDQGSDDEPDEEIARID